MPRYNSPQVDGGTHHALGVRGPKFENNYFTEMCSGSEEGSHLRLVDFVCHSTLGLGVIKKKKRLNRPRVPQGVPHRRPFVGAFQGRSWSHWVVLGAILWAFIAKN